MSFRHFSNVVIVGVTMILLSRIILAQSNIEATVTTTATIVIPVENRHRDARMEGDRLQQDLLTEAIARFNEENRKQRERLEILQDTAIAADTTNEINSVLDKIQKSKDYRVAGKIFGGTITIMLLVVIRCYRKKLCKCCVNCRSDDPLLLTDEDANDGVTSIRTSE